MHDALDSIPSTTENVCGNPTTQEVEAEGSGVQGHLQLHSEFEAGLKHQQDEDGHQTQPALRKSDHSWLPLPLGFYLLLFPVSLQLFTSQQVQAFLQSHPVATSDVSGGI